MVLPVEEQDIGKEEGVVQGKKDRTRRGGGRSS
jgi:hypothetical protein